MQIIVQNLYFYHLIRNRQGRVLSYWNSQIIKNGEERIFVQKCLLFYLKEL